MENRGPGGRQGVPAGSSHRGPVQGAPDGERGALGGGGAAVAGPDWQPTLRALQAVDGAQDGSEQAGWPWSGCTP